MAFLVFDHRRTTKNKNKNHIITNLKLILRLSPIKTELELNNLPDVSFSDIRFVISILKVGIYKYVYYIFVFFLR